MAQSRERIYNTRKRNEGKEKPERAPQVHLMAFSDYSPGPDTDGYISRHYAPVSYHCKVLRLYLDNTDGGKVQLRISRPNVDGEEFIEREVRQGENIFQVGTLIPVGTRVWLRLVEDTKALGIWVSWLGEAT